MFPTRFGFFNIEVNPTTNPAKANNTEGINIAPPNLCNFCNISPPLFILLSLK